MHMLQGNTPTRMDRDGAAKVGLVTKSSVLALSGKLGLGVWELLEMRSAAPTGHAVIPVYEICW